MATFEVHSTVSHRSLMNKSKWDLASLVLNLLDDCDRLLKRAGQPIPMLLFCPKCGLKHVDRADEATGWDNPPHKSHLCHGCGCVWRPADVPTTGVDRIASLGKADNWVPDTGTGMAQLLSENSALQALLNVPEVDDFAKGVVAEAAHQRHRWPSDHDAGKSPFDWFWLVGYLAQKAAAAAVAGDLEKAKHHTISTAAALANWHLALIGADTSMRPGIEPPAQVAA